MRRPFLAGNWKMNLDRRAAKALAEELCAQLKDLSDRDVGLFPTMASVSEIADLLQDSPIKVGGQNIWFENDGAFPGEISGSILRSTGATHVILGHSERRAIFGESDELVGQKVKAALGHGLDVILCVGETLEEREGGQTEEVITRQARAGLAEVTRDEMARITVAYEPVWAIGTGKTATPETANAAHVVIRELVCELYDKPVSEDLRIQYGGSVKPNNVDELMSMPDIDGALVGGASLDAASFARIVNFQAKD